MFQYPHGNFPASEWLFSSGKLRLAHFLLQCTVSSIIGSADIPAVAGCPVVAATKNVAGVPDVAGLTTLLQASLLLKTSFPLQASLPLMASLLRPRLIQSSKKERTD
jgi:hypothetical protein